MNHIMKQDTLSNHPKKKRSDLHLSFFLFVFLFSLSVCLGGCQNKDNNTVSPSEEESGSTSVDLTSKEQDAFDDFLDETFQTSFENDLIGLHFTVTNPDSYGIEKPEQPFPPLTNEYNEYCQKKLTDLQEKLNSFNRSRLTKKQQLFHEVLTHYTQQQLELSKQPQFANLLSADTGYSSQLPVTLSEYAFHKEEDVKDYLCILTSIPDLFTQALAWEENRTASGYGMTDFEIKDTCNQITHFLNEQNKNLLIDTFDEKIDNLSGLSSDQKNTYKKNNLNLVNTVVLPAFSSLKDSLSNLKGETEKKGLCDYEGGKEYYELLIQSKTLSDRPVSQMIRTLEKRMKTIMNRVKAVYKKTPDAYQILSDHNSFSTETPSQMLDRLKSCILTDYPSIPDVTYTVSPIPDALKDNTTAAYYMIPPIDSTTENHIYYNDEKKESTALFTTLSHEGYPGHLYQSNYFLSTSPYPLYSVIDLTGYKEGWAYYAEIDCTQYNSYGTYDAKYHDDLVELSRCNDEFGYCISSLVDLYVNAEGYSEEDIAEVLESYGLDATSAKSFYEYAIEEPGAYLQYYIGYLEILSLRNKAEKELGSEFSLLTFHKIILDAGPCYYFQIENKINDWIETVKK